MMDVNPSQPIFVYSNNGTLVAAACLAQPQGGYVPDPNTQSVAIYQNVSGQLEQVTNSENYLIVPANFSIASAQNFASQIRGLLGSPNPETAYMAIAFPFEPGGSQDLQRNYDGQTWSGNSGMFVVAFQDAASWYLGFVAQQSGLGATVALDGAGLANLIYKWKTLPSLNSLEINAGAQFGQSLPAGLSLCVTTDYGTRRILNARMIGQKAGKKTSSRYPITVAFGTCHEGVVLYPNRRRVCAC